MEATKLQSMLVCLASDKTLLSSLARWEHMLQGDDAIAAVRVWFKILRDFQAQWLELPTAQQIMSVASAYTQKELIGLDHMTASQAMGVCNSALQLLQSDVANNESVTEEVGRELLSEFLRERVALYYASQMTRPGVQIHEVTSQMTADLAAIDGTVSTQFASHFPNGYFPVAKKDYYLPIGIEFLDILLGGGLLQGEVAGHVAATGQGKTTLAHQVCYSRALGVATARIREAITKQVAVNLMGLPQVYMFVYENVENLLGNVISNAASIPRDIAAVASRLEVGQTEIPLLSSKDRKWRDYEYKQYKLQFQQCDEMKRKGIPDEAIPWPAGEQERMRAAVNIIDNTLRIVDFSGHNKQLNEYSRAGVEGIKAYIDAHQHHIGKPGVNFVVVDFVGAAADRALDQNRRAKDLRPDFIRTYPDVIGREVAGNYSCPVWAAHQLNAEENRKPQGSVPDPMAAEGCGSFLTYCAAGFASGKLNNSNVAIFKPGKNRRAAIGDIELAVGYLDRMYARWLPAKDWTIYEGRAEERSGVHENSKRKLPPAAGFRG